MLVNDAMTRNVLLVSPNQNLQEVARLMADHDLGCLPVGENDRLVGMITDRDIAVRAVAQGKSPLTTRVHEIMSRDVKYCYADEEIAEVAENMGDIQLHRLPVVDMHKRLVGILALADIANLDGPRSAGMAICGISMHADGSSLTPLQS